MLRAPLIVELDEFFWSFPPKRGEEFVPTFSCMGIEVLLMSHFKVSTGCSHIRIFSWVAFSSVIKKAQNVWETYKALVCGNSQWFD